MSISGFHHQIMSGSVLLKINFDGCLQESSHRPDMTLDVYRGRTTTIQQEPPPSSSCIIVLEKCMNNALNITQQKIVRRCCKYGLC